MFCSSSFLAAKLILGYIYLSAAAKVISPYSTRRGGISSPGHLVHCRDETSLPATTTWSLMVIAHNAFRHNPFIG